MLEVTGKYNKLSEQSRKELKDALAAAGGKIEYKFDIASQNPVGFEQGQPKQIWPSIYELSPVTYQIIDKHSGNVVNIGIPDGTDDEGNPIGFKRVRVREFAKGKFSLNLTKPEDLDYFGYFYFHPKLDGGAYQDKEVMPKIRLVDKIADAKSSYTIREKRADAVNIARHLTQAEIRDFASAMGWDESDDPIVLKEQLMVMAEEQTVEFLKFSEENISYRATIKRALDKGVLEFVPVENKYVWAGSKQTVAALERGDGSIKGSIKQMADWLVTAKNGTEIFDRIVTMLQPAKVTA